MNNFCNNNISNYLKSMQKIDCLNKSEMETQKNKIKSKFLSKIKDKIFR